MLNTVCFRGREPSEETASPDWSTCGTTDRSFSRLCLRLANRIRREAAGQPVAAGDQQISDVAVMPLMKLTQCSLPPHGPLRASCFACSATTPPPLISALLI